MKWLGQPPAAVVHSLNRPLVIGLVNNGSDRALKVIEGQFMKMLQAASGDAGLRLRFFSCPEIPRATRPQTPLGQPYAAFGELFDTQLDGLIVTGMEPQAAKMQDEPIWPSLTRLVDWAETSATPVIWSCLAAHAAVLHLDGVSRTPLGGKLSGVFECDGVAPDHPLMTGLPSRWAIPHSRHYGVSEVLLMANGYEVLSRSAEVGADIFVKRTGIPFVFFQGHPEYDPDTLVREYKRDVRRYFVGKRDQYPTPPRSYFDPDTEIELERLRLQALETNRDPMLLHEVFRLTGGAAQPNAWAAPAVQIYANWLSSVVRPGMLSCQRRDELYVDPAGQERRNAATAVAALSQ